MSNNYVSALTGPRLMPGHIRRRTQQGAALIVGLVLLMVLTVLGVSGMNMAALELTMAGNMQSQQAAFQAAETGIDIPIGRGLFTTAGVSTLAPTPLGDGSYSAQSQTTCVATTPVPDIAFSMGTATGTAQAFHFDIVSVGTGPRGATATHNQSFYVVGPGGGTGC
jgi:type IV pilus assembly protein PilX